MGKHVMLSYQWNSQDMVQKVYSGLRALGINAWMDIHGGVKGNINDRSVLVINPLSRGLLNAPPPPFRIFPRTIFAFLIRLPYG